MRWVLIPSLRITNPLTQRSLPPLLGYCSFFPFPLLETIKSLVGTKEKSFFEHSSPKKASGVSSRKKDNDFSPRQKNGDFTGDHIFIVSKGRVNSICFIFHFIFVTCVVLWLCYLCGSVTSDTLWTNPNPD